LVHPGHQLIQLTRDLFQSLNTLCIANQRERPDPLRNKRRRMRVVQALDSEGFGPAVLIRRHTDTVACVDYSAMGVPALLRDQN
jgi:hypothetical protein